MLKKLLSIVFASVLLIVTGCGAGTNNNGQSGQASECVEERTPFTEDMDFENVKFPQLTNEVSECERVAEIHTNFGLITIKLFPTMAPKAVENFITHAENGYYDGLIFHRVIENFMIQGGDPTGTGAGGESIWDAPFEDEFNVSLLNVRGALSMANSGPNTNGSQFFIVQSKDFQAGYDDQYLELGFPEEVVEFYKENGGTPWLDHRHTVFGHVIDGMDIVDTIAETEVGQADKPVEDVVIEKITIKN